MYAELQFPGGQPVNVSLLQVFSIIPVICVSVEWFPGDGWVWFVCITGFFNVLIWFILYFLGIYERLPWRHVLVVSKVIKYFVMTGTQPCDSV